MTDLNTYKNKKAEENLQQFCKNTEELSQKELQLDLYEKNTGKIKKEEHIALTKAYYENRQLLGTQSQPLNLTAETLAKDFDLL